MPQPGTCCTCASFLSDTKIPRDHKSEKPLAFDRHLECCERIICALCQYKNPRFQNYCPFCQVSSEPGVLPPNGLRLPPAYSKTSTARTNTKQNDRHLHPVTNTDNDLLPPPPYTPLSTNPQPTSPAPHPCSTRIPAQPTHPSAPTTADTTHHLSATDTLSSLSLAYSVPITVLQTHNNLFSSHLLAARKTLLIPATHYQGPPLSSPPNPVEEARKRRIRRWMVATKCADYRVAEVYLKGVVGQSEAGDVAGNTGVGVGGGNQTAGNGEEDTGLKEAIERFKADEDWERRNPLEDQRKGKGKRRGAGGSLSGQLF